MKVEYIDHMGSDLSVVNAARVSFNKEKKEFDEKDDRLIAYLANHNHWSPFSHCSLQFRVKAPLFVARQLWKSHIGVYFSETGDGWNEVSRRYVDDPPEFYTPEVWRGAPNNKKQGSTGIIDTALRPYMSKEDGSISSCYKRYYSSCSDFYEELLTHGIAPEQARMVLPQSMYTEWIWSGSLLFFARVYGLRVEEHAQAETGEIAKQIGKISSKLFPSSWDRLTKETK